MKRSLIFLLALTLAAPVLAHEKWFVDPEPWPLRWDLFFRPVPLTFALATVVLTGLGWLAWRARDKRSFIPGPEKLGSDSDRRAAIFGLIPFMIAVHAAVPLLVSGVQGQLFSPNVVLTSGWQYFLGLAQTAIALGLFYGALTRFFALALAGLWFLGLFVGGPEAMLDNIFFLGIAVFFFLAGRGPASIDRMLFPRLEPTAEQMERAVTFLRIGLGLSLIVVAFTEKFANIPLALHFLEQHDLNFTSALGIPMSNELFVICAGTVELLVGLWILFGIFPREIVLIAWIPINMTLTIFDWKELIGHLPIYGVMALLVIWSTDEETRRLWVRGLREGPFPIKPRS